VKTHNKRMQSDRQTACGSSTADAGRYAVQILAPGGVINE